MKFNYLQFGESWPRAPDEGLLLKFGGVLLCSTGSWGLWLSRARVDGAETEEGHPTILCGPQYAGELLHTLVPSQQQGQMGQGGGGVLLDGDLEWFNQRHDTYNTSHLICLICLCKKITKMH